MHNSPDLPTPFLQRRIVVIAAGLLAMLLAAGGAWLVWRVLPEVPVREVRFVNGVDAPFSHVNGDDLAGVARAVAATRVSVLRTDLADVKAAVEKLAWVRRAEVRRRLPNAIEVRIEEQTAFAVWRDAVPFAPPTAADDNADEKSEAPGKLINAFGEVFQGTLADAPRAAMPVLTGPPEASAEVLAGYLQFSRQLVQIERVPRELQLSVRRAWTIRLDNGITLEVGRRDAPLRIARFIQASRQVASLQAAGGHLDLRYRNGLAVRNANVAPSAPRSPGKVTPKSTPRSAPKARKA